MCFSDVSFTNTDGKQCAVSGLSRPEYSYQFSQRSENSSFSDADSALLSNHSCSVLNRSGTIDLATVRIACTVALATVRSFYHIYRAM